MSADGTNSPFAALHKSGSYLRWCPPNRQQLKRKFLNY
jgi:hypothetical protein